MPDVRWGAREGRIFKNKIVFTERYIPPTLRVRNEEADLLIRRLLLKLTQGPITNDITLIYGSPGVVGVGKTMIAKYASMRAVAEARRRGVNAHQVYLNVYGLGSLRRVLDLLFRELQIKVTIQGASTIDMLKLLVDYLYKNNMYLVLIIDEFQSLLKGSIDDSGLYQLLRLYEQIPDPDGVNRIIYILIAMETTDLSTLKERLPQIESQIAHRIYMRPYTSSELYTILEQRAEEGLQPWAWDEYLLEMIAEEVARGITGGSARRAINTLNVAAENAEVLGMDRIDENLVRRALAETQASLISEQELLAFDIHQLLMLLALAKLMMEKGGYVTTGELSSRYELLAELYGIKPHGHTQFHQKITKLAAELETKGIIDRRASGKKIRGRTTLYRLAPSIPADRLAETIEKKILPRVLTKS